MAGLLRAAPLFHMEERGISGTLCTSLLSQSHSHMMYFQTKNLNLKPVQINAICIFHFRKMYLTKSFKQIAFFNFCKYSI